ncbi:MAG: response regulator transcription factor [Nitrospiraceae bacterium]|nr:MAG: response regulator transcription factor [Nitrospiraceae bacterium]
MKTQKYTTKTKKNRVFIVDDHCILREGLSHLINSEEDLMVCGETDNVSDALQAIEEAEPDIVIVDISLADGSGIRLTENLVYAHPGLCVLVLSMHDETEYAERCLKSGARGYIMKQESSRNVLSAIRKVLNGEIYVSDKLNVTLLHKFVNNKFESFDSSTKPLSNRELEVYQLLGQGLKKHKIAEQLNLSVKTIETYIEHIKIKLQLKGTHDVLMHAVKSMY